MFNSNTHFCCVLLVDLAHTDHPDEKSVMTYVSSLYEVFPKEPTVQETLHDNVSTCTVWSNAVMQILRNLILMKIK